MVDSDRVAEINLRRLIKSCEKMGAQSGGLLEKDELRTFVKYLGAAQKQRDELRGSGHVSSVSRFDEYSRKIDFLRDLADQSKLALPIDTQPTMLRLRSTPLLSISQKTDEAHTRLRAKRRTEGALRDTLMSKSGEEEGERNIDDELAREELLQQDRNMQHHITEGMASLAASLKDNTYRISNILKEGNATVDELNQMVENNVNNTKVESRRVKEHSRHTAWSTLSLCLLLFVVMMVFIGTYLFMKLFPKH